MLIRYIGYVTKFDGSDSEKYSRAWVLEVNFKGKMHYCALVPLNNKARQSLLLLNAKNKHIVLIEIKTGRWLWPRNISLNGEAAFSSLSVNAWHEVLTLHTEKKELFSLAFDSELTEKIRKEVVDFSTMLGQGFIIRFD